MLNKYATFDFGKSFFRDIPVVELIIEKMPVSISHRSLDDADHVFGLDPAGRRPRRCATAANSIPRPSAIVIVGSAIPAFLFAILLIVAFCRRPLLHWFPLRGLTSDNWVTSPGRPASSITSWHMALPAHRHVDRQFRWR